MNIKEDISSLLDGFFTSDGSEVNIFELRLGKSLVVAEGNGVVSGVVAAGIGNEELRAVITVRGEDRGNTEGTVRTILGEDVHEVSYSSGEDETGDGGGEQPLHRLGRRQGGG